MVIAMIVIIIIILLLVIIKIIHNNNNDKNNSNNDYINKNQVIWLKKCFSGLCFKVFKLSAFFNISGIWF